MSLFALLQHRFALCTMGEGVRVVHTLTSDVRSVQEAIERLQVKSDPLSFFWEILGGERWGGGRVIFFWGDFGGGRLTLYEVVFHVNIVFKCFLFHCYVLFLVLFPFVYLEEILIVQVGFV